MRALQWCLLLQFLLCTYLSGQYQIDGELKKWHKITLTFDGPETDETATPNPFTDYRLNVTFVHDETEFVVPGYFAADGDAANTGASSGNKWRVHFSPGAEGLWEFSVSFRTGPNVAAMDEPDAGAAGMIDNIEGSFVIGPTDKGGTDHRGKGRLKYVGEHYLQYEETGEYFIKIGADAPENLLAYEDFDGTPNYGERRKTWGPHIQDWVPGDPTWQDEKGKGIIGALNYLASEGQNAFSFLTMNIGGDDKNVFMYIDDTPQNRTRFDCSKLDQWEIVLEHADHMGMYMHFKTQEQENDQLLDGGSLGLTRIIYYRELIARYSHHLALNWNIGEENTNTLEQRKQFAEYFDQHDPYHHLIVIHTFPGQASEVYADLVGDLSLYTGASLQVNFNNVHQRTLTWVENSAASGKKWVVANDEQGNANVGVPHDTYGGSPEQDDIRKYVLWGNLMAGGAGVEYYFGYSLPHSDLTCEDFRSRDGMWDYNKVAHEFFTTNLAFWKMENHNELVANDNNINSRYCFAEVGKSYAIYLADGGPAFLDLQSSESVFTVKWFNPRTGGELIDGEFTEVTGPGLIDLGVPPMDETEDWVVLVTTDSVSCPIAGTACDDEDDSTFNDVEDGNCGCAGTPCPEAGTTCDDGNPATIDDVEDGFCNCSGNIPGASLEAWLEAECATIGAQWTLQADGVASNGQYLTPPAASSLNNPPDQPEDWVVFTFTVAEAGPYRLYARTMTLADEGDSFWVRANEGEWIKWNKINANNYAPIYQWDQAGNWTGGGAPPPTPIQLEAGENQVIFAWREPSSRLDKIYITPEVNLPSGEGAIDPICSPISSTIINESLAIEQIRFYPNPANDQLLMDYNIEGSSSGQGTLQITDAQGSLVRTQTIQHRGKGQLNLDVSILPPGLYYFTLTIHTASITRKVTVFRD